MQIIIKLAASARLHPHYIITISSHCLRLSNVKTQEYVGSSVFSHTKISFPIYLPSKLNSVKIHSM